MSISVIKKTLLAAMLVGVTGSALAVTTPGAVVNVSGTITSQTCTVAATDVNKAIALNVVDTNALFNASALSPVTFSFDISGCDPSLSKATATIGGTQVGSDVTGYGSSGLIANTGTATNVGIGFLGATSVGSSPTGVLPVGTASAIAPLAVASGANSASGTLYLAAQIVPLVKASTANAGTVAGTATVTFSYS